MVRFVHVLSILNVDSTSSTDLPNDVVIAHLNGTSLIQIGANSLVSTAQDHEFVVATYDFSNHHNTQQYIHTKDQVVSINYGNALMHVVFQ